MKSLVASLFLASLLTSCASGPTVSTDHDPAVTFSSYHTYAWLKQPEGINPLAEQRIVAGVESRLAAKGWTKAASPEQADVAVAANVASHQEQSLDTMYTGMGGWGYYGWGGMGMASSTTRVTTYTVGTLVLDMFDTKTKRAIWRGTASGTVSEKPEQNTANIEAALNKMFTNFPPGSAPPAK
jgi:hypothetical protein